MNLAKIMIPKISTVFLYETNTVRQGMETMLRHGYTALPVLNSADQYIGCISEGDFLRHLLSVGTTDKKAQEKYTIAPLLRRDFCPALTIDAPRDEVVSLLLKQNFLPITDDRGYLCGIVTRQGIIRYLSEEIKNDPPAPTRLSMLKDDALS